MLNHFTGRDFRQTYGFKRSGSQILSHFWKKCSRRVLSIMGTRSWGQLTQKRLHHRNKKN